MPASTTAIAEPDPALAPAEDRASPTHNLSAQPSGMGEDTISADPPSSATPVTEEPGGSDTATRPRVRPRTIDVRSLVFDPIWYLAQYADVAVAGLDPVQHYLDNGGAEGRDPNPFFSTAYYRDHNPDVVACGMNPFLHYILYGAREGRAPRG